MPFHFVNFRLEGPIFAFKDWMLEYEGEGDPYPLDIVVFTQPLDRYTKLYGASNVAPSAMIQLAGPQLALLPAHYEGFVVERSDDLGITWADVSGVVSGTFFYVDIPPGPGVYYYRARMKAVSGVLSLPGNEVVCTVGEWGDVDDLGVSELDVTTGAVLKQLQRNNLFPQGFDGEAHTGMSQAEGSMAGGYGEGAWYIKTREFMPPIAHTFIPSCGSIGVSLPLTVLTFSLRDYPYPGGSGIDDSNLTIRLAVTSQSAGAPLVVRSGASQPFAPTITCVVVPGADPALDRDVTITVPAGYIGSGDTVTILIDVYDLDGNHGHAECLLEMESVDDEPPTITYNTPVCGTGIDNEARVPRDASVVFTVEDAESGVDLATLQVYLGPTNTGPWTQILQNGTTWLLGYSGSIIPFGSTGYQVTVHRPVTDPLWPADTLFCFRVRVEDIEGNMAEETCCWRTEDEARIKTVVPIAEDIIYIEFTVPMRDGVKLRNADNYQIDPLDPQYKLVRVREIQPQQFTPPSYAEAPTHRLGDGDPVFVYLNTTYHDHWGRYKITLTGLEDRYGLPMASDGQEAEYRARRTKVDEARDGMDGDTSRSEGLTRQVLVGIAHGDEQIGGTFISDNDWEDS